MAEQEQIGQLALVVGDFHIPLRSSEIPPKYKQILTPNKVSAVFCTGNIGSRQVHDWCKSLASTFHVVQGDYQDQSVGEFPDHKVFQFCGVRIGIIHGHQVIPWGDQEAIQNKAKELGVNLIISGNSHQIKTSQNKGTYFLNPGSMTGAYSALQINAIPSFMILEFKSTEIVIYQYSLVDGELNCVDIKIPKL